MITHLGPDILECEVKWALESITTKKTNGGAEETWELTPGLEDALRQLNRDSMLSSQESKAEYLHTSLLIW